MADLKGHQITLNNENSVVSSGDEIISLAGIIGSQNTAINSKTTNILIESAFFSSHFIKKTTQRLNFSTPASQYFSKGYNLPFGDYALIRLIKLIKEICPKAEIEKNVVS
jgi:phenylalanyl-tRNA synthetase beta chain